MDNEEIKAKCGAYCIKKWILTNPNGEIFYISNLRQFCIKNDLNKSNLVQVAKGKFKSSKGWKCAYDLSI